MQVQKILTWVTAVLENLFFTGAMFGWSHLELVLKKEKFCSEDCNHVFTIAIAVAFFSILTKKFIDKCGVWTVRTIAINLACLCYLILAFVPNTSSFSLYICFPIIHLCGFTLYLQKLQTANLFPDKRNIYVATVSGAF